MPDEKDIELSLAIISIEEGIKDLGERLETGLVELQDAIADGNTELINLKFHGLFCAARQLQNF